MARKAASPHDEETGFVSARENVQTKGWVVLYDGEEAGFDTQPGRWNLFCPAHGALMTETSKTRANKLLRNPQDWCPQCRTIASAEIEVEGTRIIRLDKTPEELEREMRFWAKKAKNNPEKQALFEKMYAVSPERFWD